ncbi:hypothetical protein AAA775_001449 [Providencia stuartii]
MYKKTIRAVMIIFAVMAMTASPKGINIFSNQCEAYKGIPKRIAAMTFGEQLINQQRVFYTITLVDGKKTTQQIAVFNTIEHELNKKMLELIQAAFVVGAPVTIQQCEQASIAGLMVDFNGGKTINRF